MKWELKETKEVKGKELRTYRNDATGTECQTELLITDERGVKWFGFKDLRQIPYIRITYAKHISDLYTNGLSLKDILDWCSKEKKLIKSKDDPERDEKLYAMILEKERLASFTADPIKQHLALASVYVLKADERIDYFSDPIAEEKLMYWNADPALIAFFLSWLNSRIISYIKILEKISPIVLKHLQQNQAGQ